MARSYGSPEVAAVFGRYAPPVRRRLSALRKLILRTAAATPGVGVLTETLKWGQPSYLTMASGSGSTIRIDATKNGGTAMYFHCHSGLVPQFRELYDGVLKFEGKRAILFGMHDEVPEDALGHCIALALTHHLAKAKRRAG